MAYLHTHNHLLTGQQNSSCPCRDSMLTGTCTALSNGKTETFTLGI